MKKFKDDKYTIKKNDLDAIRLRPAYIIGNIGPKGVEHLVHEIVDNNRDECLKKESPGNLIDIVMTDKEITCRDNGRGIPCDLLRIVHETQNAGSNMTRAGGNTSGENGIGTTAYTALASELTVITIRPSEKKKYTVMYKEGQFIGDMIEDYTGKDHGLITKFKPSKKILDTDEIPCDDILEWLKMFDYTLPEDISMRYNINGKQYETVHRNIGEFISERIPREKSMSDILTFTCEGDLVENVRGESYDRHFEVEAAIMYSTPDYKGEEIQQSWMNMIHTSSGGMHINGVINGFSKYIIEKVLKKKKNLEDEDLKRDVLSHLNVVVKANCNFANMFDSQAKRKVDQKTILAGITKATYEKLGEISQQRLNDMVEIVIANNRVRREGEKARIVSDVSKKKNKWEKPKAFIPCSSAKTKEGKELYLVEGLSAGGGLRSARDARYQAILQFRGKSLNPWDKDLARVLQSVPWNDLVNILECGIGSTFDIKKLAYDKIILATDADIDGYHIRTGWASFFLKYMPGIIEEGRLYIAEPPLYKLKSDKRVIYVTSTHEYITECINTLGDMQCIFGERKMKAKEFTRDRFDYMTKLREASINKMTNRYLLEYIASGFAEYGSSVEAFINNIDKWMKKMHKIYKELWFDKDTNQIIATIDLTDQYVIIDQSLIDELSYVIDTHREYGMFVNILSSSRQLNENLPLSKYFEYIEKFYPIIKDRYKGLGSSAATVSKETIMDPRTRRLIKVTINDVNTWNSMATLVGKTNENVQNRKELLLGFKFTAADLDN